MKSLLNFYAVNGVDFVAKTTSTSNDLFCLSNPTQSNIVSKSIVQTATIDTESFEPFNDTLTNTDISVYPNPSKGNFKLVLHAPVVSNASIYIV